MCETCSSGCGCFPHHVRAVEGADICIHERKCPQQDMRMKSLETTTPGRMPAPPIFPRPAKHLETTTPGRMPAPPIFSRRAKQSRTHSASLEVKPEIRGKENIAVTLVRSKTLRTVARASKTVKRTMPIVQGPKKVQLPKQSFVKSKPTSASAEKSKETIKTLMIPAHMGEHGPTPPPRHLHDAAVSKKGSLSTKRGPPSTRPLHYGPPSISPSDFFRLRRQRRKGRKVRRLRVRHMVKQ
ncbi:unnamed protein product [Cylicocyclus nassatus]|uniref:Uncharacterized protein n=1 Tax=Cylicocyclus nassatus TaxID=53992 RepID=A0AA36DP81_CYLNA|nr:unnamed protein product [Cylicocyclus nassatus]